MSISSAEIKDGDHHRKIEYSESAGTPKQLQERSSYKVKGKGIRLTRNDVELVEVRVGKLTRQQTCQ